jgi:hypothetical protein
MTVGNGRTIYTPAVVGSPSAPGSTTPPTAEQPSTGGVSSPPRTASPDTTLVSSTSTTTSRPSSPPPSVAGAGAQLVFVSDREKHRVQVFDVGGRFRTMFGSSGSGPGQFLHPSGLAVDPRTQQLFVCDFSNHRVQVFTLAGTFVTMWGVRGSMPGQFVDPVGVSSSKSVPAPRLVGVEPNPGPPPLSGPAFSAARAAARREAALPGATGATVLAEAVRAAEGLGAGAGATRFIVGLYVLYVRCSNCGSSGGSDADSDGDSSAAAPAQCASCPNLERQVATVYQAAEKMGGAFRPPQLGVTEFYEGSVKSTGPHALPQLQALLEAAANGDLKGVTVFAQRPDRFGRRLDAKDPHRNYVGLTHFLDVMEKHEVRIIFSDWLLESVCTHTLREFVARHSCSFTLCFLLAGMAGSSTPTHPVLGRIYGWLPGFSTCNRSAI